MVHSSFIMPSMASGSARPPLKSKLPRLSSDTESIGYESGESLHCNAILPIDSATEMTSSVTSSRVSAVDDLYELHQGDRVHEMHPNNSLRPCRGFRNRIY